MVNTFIKLIKNSSNQDIWSFFALSKKELKKRKLIRTNNITGERGEFLTIEKYNATPGMPNLQAAPEGTQNVDAISRRGERYSIKTMTLPSKTTSVFYGCGDLNEKQILDRKFEYVVIVQVDEEFNLKKMVEINWNQFLKFRRWHKTMRGWNISITKELLREARHVY